MQLQHLIMYHKSKKKQVKTVIKAIKLHGYHTTLAKAPKSVKGIDAFEHPYLSAKSLFIKHILDGMHKESVLYIRPKIHKEDTAAKNEYKNGLSTRINKTMIAMTNKMSIGEDGSAPKFSIDQNTPKRSLYFLYRDTIDEIITEQKDPKVDNEIDRRVEAAVKRTMLLAVLDQKFNEHLAHS